ncbi:hypothetical protein PMIN06_004465 [Paraphaeosphaeria minitans]|uniref:Uncharacterized protein n=1 Tax=Paraphaeosphaeria minitans TaxID=565426 RepID=A0A9P6GFF8_9PLEO|nr:hypothetical protein PMIN01_07124 [Paraphaeosphaeria minitans]
MPPKKDESAATVGDTITGFTSKESKMIAAAFVASTGADKVHSYLHTSYGLANRATKYDYELFATLTGNTVGSLKKMWPPVKRKVIEAHTSFGVFLGAATAGEEATGEAKAKPAPKVKAKNGKKRKATSTEPENEDEDGAKDGAGVEDAGKKKPGPKGRKKKADSADAEGEGEKKAPAKKGRKKVKSEEDVADDEAKEEV